MRYVLAAAVGRNCTGSLCHDAQALSHLPPAYPHTTFFEGFFPEALTEIGVLRFGYVIHPGVSPEPPYHLGLRIRSSIELMLEAYSSFNAVVPQVQPAWVVLSSYAWDMARRFTYFPDMSEEAWLMQYKSNFSKVASILSRATSGHLMLVADYGCRRQSSADGLWNASHWTESQRQHYCTGELYKGYPREKHTADIVVSIGKQMGLPTVNLQEQLRDSLKSSLLSEGCYLHPTKETSLVIFRIILKAITVQSNHTIQNKHLRTAVKLKG